MQFLTASLSTTHPVINGLHTSSDWILRLAITAAILMIIYRMIVSNPGSSTRRPPAPPGLPILGHLHLLGNLPHQSLWKLSQKYGPFISLRLGSVDAVVASTPDLAKQILHIHDEALSNRPRTAAAVYLCFDCRDVTFAPLGRHWRFMRQIYANELFSPKRMESFRGIREEEVHELAKSITFHGDAGKQAIGVRDFLLTASNNINCRMTMGKKMKEVSATSNWDLHACIQEEMHLLGLFHLGDYIPWLAWLDPNGNLRRMKTIGAKLKAILAEIIEKRRQEPQVNGHHRDLLDFLLATADSSTLADGNKNDFLTDDDIMATITDVLLGGSDTSPTVVEWAIADLINNPQAMLKAQQELDNVIGKERLVRESDIPQLTYLDNVLKESMRLHPIAPLLVPREAHRECVIDGYRILPKTRIYVNIHAIQRDPSIWERPFEFLPERFHSKDTELKGHYFDFLPFGLGRRRCPGYALGIANVRLMLAALIHGFSWECADTGRGEMLHMTEKFGLVVELAHSVRRLAKPRLPLDVYF
ncbi:hypothetical protein KP509_05G013300 [Ceratopteris richardii]|uniref:Cytochrome P450 n=1 Tax=Ceratopteris richardii TaxID=49495 RepID=A0A8T2USF1_CERRI|nr:hypothetical protein KP509_05G013300 [Ceratopteris richardii]